MLCVVCVVRVVCIAFVGCSSSVVGCLMCVVACCHLLLYPVCFAVLVLVRHACSLLCGGELLVCCVLFVVR